MAERPRLTRPLDGAGGWWYLPSPDGEGCLVLNAHPEEACSGACALHRPSRHPMRDWPVRWVKDRGVKAGVMERRCPHGRWHHDPDDLDYRRQRGMPQPWAARDTCDGSCACCDVACDFDAPF